MMGFEDNPQVQLGLGVLLLTASVLAFIFGTGESKLQSSLFVLVLSLLFIGRYWRLVCGTANE
jgi:hypothetical protein